jgi:hypothetical protein
VPFLKDHFGILSANFQWLDLPESETLVFTGTRKPEVLEVPEIPENQKYQKTISTRKPKAPVQKFAGQF